MPFCGEMQGLPKPYNLVAHSMGGCIGLRALVAGLDVKSAVFTGPMWGIRIAPHLRPVAAVFSRIMPMIGQGLALTPGTTLDPYVLNEPFETNTLTRSEAMYKMMRDQLVAHPELCLAGPSFTWLREALGETKALATMPSPNIPCLTYLGTEEEIVHVGRIKDRMSRWPKGHLRMVEGGAHEVLMETSKKTAPLYDEIVAFFARASD